MNCKLPSNVNYHRSLPSLVLGVFDDVASRNTASHSNRFCTDDSYKRNTMVCRNFTQSIIGFSSFHFKLDYYDILSDILRGCGNKDKCKMVCDLSPILGLHCISARNAGYGAPNAILTL